MAIIGKFLLELIFPRRCLGCDVLLGNESQSYLCRKCPATIPFTHGFACAFCKSPVKAGKTCPFCRKIHFLDRLFVTTSYENPLVGKILKALKYRFVKSLADDIAKLMIRHSRRVRPLTTGLDIDGMIVAPVPLHRRRLNKRGFNQSEIIGTAIADYLGLRFYPRLLKRAESRPPQADMLDRQSRIKNAEGLFELSPAPRTHKVSIFGHRKTEDKTEDRAGNNGLAGKTVLLIDDVSTTGSTLDDCARALKGAGAKEVWGFVFARGK